MMLRAVEDVNNTKCLHCCRMDIAVEAAITNGMQAASCSSRDEGRHGFKAHRAEAHGKQEDL